MEREQINPFAVGGAFVQYCVNKGHIEIVMNEHEVNYFLTSDGAIALSEQFGIVLGSCAKIKE